MRGSKKATKRKIIPDPKFNNVRVAKFINYLMRRGKKTVAQKVVYKTFDIISNKTKGDPLEIFEQAIKNITPSLEVKGRRIGGANYQIPVVVGNNRKVILAYRWIINAAQVKKGKAMAEKLAEEILAASKNEGEAVKKKDDTHKMAEANKAFAHFA
ncbi:30S ribosomal protein S7 [Patescibacteria group bacterium]|nr:30S ribosomal protein S7 [Patescibacteria group bacterium]